MCPHDVMRYELAGLYFSPSLSINTIERKRFWNRPVAYRMCQSVGLSVGLWLECTLVVAHFPTYFFQLT